jgi:hypothetical protein
MIEVKNMTERHKVFVSYHDANDQKSRKKFEEMCEDVIVSQSVDIDDIDPDLKTETIRQKIRDEYLRDSTVTVVLIGKQTWQRKHVDWEIGSSIRQTEYNPRSGLLGIILPTYPRQNSSHYNPCTIPPRLHDNIECGYAKIYNWSTNPTQIQEWIHEAFLRKDREKPNNSYPQFGKNHSGPSWC